MSGLQTYKQGGAYDCAITSVLCESNITRDIVFSQEDYSGLIYWYDLIIAYIGMTILLVSGIAGNILNIIIFSTNKIANESTNLLLLATAVSDLLHLLSHTVLQIGFFLCFFDVSAAISASNMAIPMTYYHNRWFSQLSLDFVSVLAVQRAAAVMLPFRASILFSYKNTKIIVTALGIICITTFFPLYFHHFPLWTFHPFFNKSISLGYEYFLEYVPTQQYHFVYCSIRGVISMVVINVAVTVTIVKLKEQGKARSGLKATETVEKSNSSQMSVKEMKAMRMSLAVCIVTLLVQTAVTVMMCVNLPNVDRMYATPVAPLSLFGAETFAKFNCSFNFFLYLIMSPQYKQAFGNLFRWKKK